MNIREIREEIQVLEKSETTWQNIEKLSWLYSISEHFKPKIDIEECSDFVKICIESDFEKIVEILDEHMNVVKILHPKEYQSLLDRMANLK